jgi:ATP-dependent DNA ligase
MNPTMQLPEIQPVVPRLGRVLPKGPEWRYEKKIDGFRGTFFFDGARAWFRSKTMKPMPRFAPLAAEIARELRTPVILDGEIVVMRGDEPDFYALMHARGEPRFVAFDLLWSGRADLRALAYAERKDRLRRLAKRYAAIGCIEPTRDPSLFEDEVRLDREGIVAKRIGDPYDARRTAWVKVKNATYSQAVGRSELFEKRRGARSMAR